MEPSLYKEFGWSDDGSKFYHRLLNEPVERLLSPPRRGGCPILDVGCGNGYFANRLIDKGYDVYGIDASQEGIRIARSRNPQRFYVCDVTEGRLPEPLRKIRFGTVLSLEVIEHLYSPQTFVRFMHSVLEEGGDRDGRLILTTPYHGYLKNVALAVSGSMDRHLSALWEGGHIKFWSKRTLSILLSEAGFKEMEFTGVGRFPYLWKHMICRARL